MREAAAFLRQDFLSATSYRVNTVLRLAGLLALVVPVYFIAGALQPVMADSIRGQGGQYFAFVVVGLMGERFVVAALGSLPAAVSSGIRTGTLEAWFATPVRMPALLAGLMGYRLLWTTLQGVVLLTAAWALGAQFVAARVPAALLVAGLIVLAYVPLGVLGAAAVLAFRTTGALPAVVVTGSVFLGGVYYPTEVIPSWLEQVSAAIPLTYGLRALRKTFLEGLPLETVAGDLVILLGFIAVLMAISVFVFGRALGYARRNGTLAMY